MQIMPIPIPINNYGGGDPHTHLAVAGLISIDLVLVVLFLVISICYFLKRKHYYDNAKKRLMDIFDLFYVEFIIYLFCAFNSIALFFWLSLFIYEKIFHNS